MKIYGGFVSALNPNGFYETTPVTLNAVSKDIALIYLQRYSRNIVYPVDVGYTKHTADVIEVTSEQIEAVK